MIFTLTARDLVHMGTTTAPGQGRRTWLGFLFCSCDVSFLTVGRAHINLLIEGAHVYQPLTLVHAIQALGSVGTLLVFVSHTKVRALR